MMCRVGKDVAGFIQMDDDGVTLEQCFTYKGRTGFPAAIPTAQLGAFCYNVSGLAHAHGVVHDIELVSSRYIDHIHGATDPKTEATDTVVRTIVDVGHVLAREVITGVPRMAGTTIIDMIDIIRHLPKGLGLVCLLLVAASKLSRQHPAQQQCLIMMIWTRMIYLVLFSQRREV
ncbi:hypothetical protein KVR01_013042 [Diaporthe batatas]|uniref:uncharacterized protein n=1 Tax=Diaporthe batatas TaxID=748121 RepID=UPI001D045944|nr:uncharacterized protein KVR01_013042 [Diaporthe batatas]KAG8157052.1 hypothetical protein KVR01_013042 [Diaporthe batatas]